MKKLTDILPGEENESTERNVKHPVRLALFLMVLAILYIYNGYAYEQQVVELNRSEKVLRETKYTYVYRQAELSRIRMRSNLKARLQENGSNIVDPPEVIEKIEEK